MMAILPSVQSPINIRSALKALAFHALSLLPPTFKAVTITAKNRSFVASIIISPAGEAAATALPPPRLAGRFLSDLEAAVVNALDRLGPDERMLGKVIAARLTRDYDPKLKIILANMLDRGILDHEPTRGYRLASAAPVGGKRLPPPKG